MPRASELRATRRDRASLVVAAVAHAVGVPTALLGASLWPRDGDPDGVLGVEAELVRVVQRRDALLRALWALVLDEGHLHINPTRPMGLDLDQTTR